MNKKNFGFVAAVACLTLASCGEKDLYNPDFAKETFASNFQKHYEGTYDANTSWDLAGNVPMYTLGSIDATRSTRAGEFDYTVDDEWYYVEKPTLDYMLDELKEGDNNRAKGKPFYLSSPQNGFAIYPIYQGGAAWKWNLHMVVEQDGIVVADLNVWQKHKDMECQLTEEQIEQDLNPVNRDGNPCTPFFEQFGYSRNTTDWYDTHHTFSLEPGGWWQNYEYGWNAMSAAAIRTKGIHFGQLPEGASIHFYLEVFKEIDGEWKHTDNESSLNAMMVALTDVERPTNIAEDKEVMILGCEDNHYGDSDWDMNDFVFMVVGDPKLPGIIDVVEHRETVAKRYMIEDLGDTDDFDFNDIVLDVKDETVREVTYEAGVKVKDELKSQSQAAILRHRGGIYPWRIMIGGATSKWYDGVLGDTPNVELVKENGTPLLDGKTWVPAENNIKIEVKGRGENSDDVYVVEFPENGAAPMIIATKTTAPWMDERVKVPAEWWEKNKEDKK